MPVASWCSIFKSILSVLIVALIIAFLVFFTLVAIRISCILLPEMDFGCRYLRRVDQPDRICINKTSSSALLQCFNISFGIVYLIQGARYVRLHEDRIFM